MADALIATLTKVCTRCGAEKPADLEHFTTHSLGKHRLHPMCRPCKKADDTERRSRPDQKARQQAWRDANKVKTKAYNDKYRETYSSTEDVARWRLLNLEHARASEARRRRERRASDPAFRLQGRLSARLASMLADKAGRSTFEILGYSSDELRRHIERQFLPGMSWQNMGEWHVDHILPVSAFSITSVDDPDLRICWGLPNLRPMWAADNMKKGSKRLYLI